MVHLLRRLSAKRPSTSEGFNTYVTKVTGHEILRGTDFGLHRVNPSR